MRITVLLLTLIITIAFVSSAFAVPPGKKLEFEGGDAGKVVMDGKVHFDKELKCTDCHTAIFQMKQGSVKMTMDEMKAGKLCGVCHNGEKAFKTDDEATCSKCHQKAGEAAPGY